MAREPSQRYTGAQEMADDLKRFLADEPIRAKRAGPLVRLKKWAKRHKAVTAMAAMTVVVAGIVAAVTAVQAHQRDVRLTAVATEGLADVRVAVAQKEFGEAQRRATELQAELAAAPKLKAQFGPELEDLLRQAEARLRLQRFEKLADEARFSANRLLHQWWRHDPADASGHCREALSVFHVLDRDGWLEDLEGLPLERAEVAEVKQSIVELLFLLAAVEMRSPDQARAARQAVAILNRLETLAPNLRALYEYRSRYWSVLGDQQAASSDSKRAQTMQRNTWLDHYFRVIELGHEKLAEPLREIEAALTFRPDDYWSWHLWSDLQRNLGAPDRCRWGLSICIRLRPEEASAWVSRGHTGPGYSEKIADLSRALELTSDPVLRTMTHLQLANVRLALGQPEASLADCESALRLTPDNAGLLRHRAFCYQALGQLKASRADARRVLELTNQPTKSFWDRTKRIDAFRLLGEPQQAAEEALALFKAEGLREMFLPTERLWEEGVEPYGAFLLAMVRWKQGQKEDARRLYDKAVKWMDENKPKDETLVLFRAEAAELLGIAKNEKKPAVGKEVKKAP
jgi:tetratricopeptide (TPR) repeat protein